MSGTFFLKMSTSHGKVVSMSVGRRMCAHACVAPALQPYRTKKEAASSAVFCKNNRLRLVTLFQILSPVHFVYMLYVAFALQTLLVGCDWPYFRTCDSPVTGIIFSILSKFECACRLIKKGPSEADKLLRQTPFPLRIILLYLFVSPAGAALSDTLLPAVHPGPSNCTGPSSYCSRSLRQQ